MKRVVLLLLFCAATAFHQKEKTWVAIGDSITYLNDHLNETGNRVTKGYLTGVTEKLPGIRYINQGHNGWTAGGIAAALDKLGLVPADIYTIFLGTNDWWQGRPLGTLDDYRQNTGNGTVHGSYRLIVNKLRSLNPAARMVLITPMQRVDFVYLNNPKNNAYGSYREKAGQTLESFANAIAAIGRLEGLPVVDLYHHRKLAHKRLVAFKRVKDPATGQYRQYKYPKFIGVPFNPETDEYPYPAAAIAATYDGLHPSDRGYAIITREVAKALKK